MKFPIKKYLILGSLFCIVSFSIFSGSAFGHYEKPLSGYGTAKIDGMRSIGEWDNAHVISVFGGKSNSDLLLVMNDKNNLYLALYVVDNVLTQEDYFEILFDNSHNGILNINDDSGGVSGVNSVYDGHFNGAEWITDSHIDGNGAVQREGDRNFFEYSKPLKSGDENDLNLSIGDDVGFCITYVKDGIVTNSLQFGPSCRLLDNDQKNYGDILLVPYSVTWHGQMAMDADKRNVEYGDTINYQGYLYGDQLIEDQLVYFTISELETGKTILNQTLIPESESVDYFANPAWPFTFEVSTSRNDFRSGLTYVATAKYGGESAKLNLLIKPDSNEDGLESKAIDASNAIVDAGKETGELVVEAGKEAGKVISDVGGKAVEKGTIVGETVSEKSTETGKIIAEKGAEGIEEIQEKGGGCLIATAAYGTELAPQVQLLREIRDQTVMSTNAGVTFMSQFNQIYYSFSPTIADIEREHPLFQEAVRLFITPMISTLSVMNFAEDGNESQILILGGSVIGLNMLMYFGIPAIIGFSIYKKKINHNMNKKFRK